MALVRTTQTIAAPVDRVWSFIRNFNDHEKWHPAVIASAIEGAQPKVAVGDVRSFRLTGGEKMRQRLLSLSDTETMFRYCALETPLPLFGYIADLRLTPVTLHDWTFVDWSARFHAPASELERLVAFIRDDIQRAGIAAIEREVTRHAG